LKKYWEVLHIRSYLAYTIIGASTSAALFGYVSGAPFVYMNLFGQSEKTFGYIFAIIAAGLITCSQINTFLLNKYTSRQILRVALTAQFIIGIILLFLASFNILELTSSIVLICMFLSCQGFVFPNATALSLEPFERDAGSASALGGAIQMAMAALASGMVGLFKPTNAIPMTLIMTSFVAIGTATYYIFTLVNSKPKLTAFN
jgi:DHA1 family bicyclomycin/chloramphenicol resistance-like MFS transporter